MVNRIMRAMALFCAATFWTIAANAQAVSDRPKAVRSPITLSMALSWLPADTETLIVANGPFLLSRFHAESDETRSRSVSKKELRERFEALPLGLLGVEKGLLEKHLNGREVAIGIEGSRHFRSPSGLGEMPYEGCDIVVFAGDVTSLGDAFMKESKNVAAKFEEVEGRKVAVFREQLEQDVWTALVAFPKANVLVVGNGRSRPRGLPLAKSSAEASLT